MPYSEGVFMEPDNVDRAGWALLALNAFCAETRYDPREQSVDVGDKDHIMEVASDLVCDLMHLCKQYGVDPEEVISQARLNYEFEEEEEDDG